LGPSDIQTTDRVIWYGVVASVPYSRPRKRKRTYFMGGRTDDECITFFSAGHFVLGRLIWPENSSCTRASLLSTTRARMCRQFLTSPPPRIPRGEFSETWWKRFVCPRGKTKMTMKKTRRSRTTRAPEKIIFTLRYRCAAVRPPVHVSTKRVNLLKKSRGACKNVSSRGIYDKRR